MLNTPFFRYEYGLIAVGILAVAFAMFASADHSSAKSESAWPYDVADRACNACVEGAEPMPPAKPRGSLQSPGM